MCKTQAVPMARRGATTAYPSAPRDRPPPSNNLPGTHRRHDARLLRLGERRAQLGLRRLEAADQEALERRAAGNLHRISVATGVPAASVIARGVRECDDMAARTRYRRRVRRLQLVETPRVAAAVRSCGAQRERDADQPRGACAPTRVCRPAAGAPRRAGRRRRWRHSIAPARRPRSAQPPHGTPGR